MARFATGKYAWAYCDVCGIRCKYMDLRETTIRGRRTNTLACPRCWDKDHEQNFLPEAVAVLPDPEALEHARPDTGLAASRKLYPNANWPPYPPGPAKSGVRPAAFRTGDAGGNT